MPADATSDRGESHRPTEALPGREQPLTWSFEAEVRLKIEDALPTRKSRDDDPKGAEARRREAVRWLRIVRRMQIRDAQQSINAARLEEAKRLANVEARKPKEGGYSEEESELSNVDRPPKYRRATLDEVGDGTVDPDIREFFAQAARRIWSSSDPVAAMDMFVNGRKGRRPPVGEDKRFRDAVALFEKVREADLAGKSVTAVLREIAGDEELAGDRARDVKNGGETAFARVQREYYRASRNPKVREEYLYRQGY